MSDRGFKKIADSEERLRAVLGHPGERALGKERARLDEHFRTFIAHLAIPDRIGNNRLDGMRNILENAHVGLTFFIPGRDDTLRINGRAWIVEDDDLLDSMVMQGKRPTFAIGVEVEEAFMHCPRAFMRSGLWKPERWPDAATVPSMAAMLWDQLPTKPDFPSVEAYAADQQRRLQTPY